MQSESRTSAWAPGDRLLEIVDVLPGGRLAITTVERALNWARSSSLWHLTFGLPAAALR